MTIDDLKAETNGLIVKNKIKILVVIDDIDRLSPPEILEIFQLVKLNANFKNTVFLLAYDKSVVTESIVNQFKLNGESYLEKIIQVDYSLPAISSDDLEKIFFDRLGLFVETHEIKFNSRSLSIPWLVEGLNHYFRTIRDLNRYFNSIAFRLPSFHKNLDVHDFLIIEVIRLFDFESYDLIRKYHKEVARFGDHSKFKNELDRVYTGKSSSLYNYLFKEKSEEQRMYRISDLEFFDRYFTLSTSSKDIREEEFEHFIRLKDQRRQLLVSIVNNGKLSFLLNRISASASDIPSSEKTELIEILLGVWSTPSDTFIISWRDLWNCIKIILHSFEEESAGYRELVEILARSTHGFNPARFVLLWFVLDNLDGLNARNHDKDLESHMDLLESKRAKLEQAFKHILEDFRSQFFFMDKESLYTRIFLPSLAKYDAENYKHIFTHLVNDEKRVFILLNMFVFRDARTREPFGIDPMYIPILLPGNFESEFTDRLKSIKPNAVSKQDYLTIKAFLEFRKSPSKKNTSRRKV